MISKADEVVVISRDHYETLLVVTIVAIWRAQGTLRITRDEYAKAVRAQGGVQGGPAMFAKVVSEDGEAFDLTTQGERGALA